MKIAKNGIKLLALANVVVALFMVGCATTETVEISPIAKNTVVVENVVVVESKVVESSLVTLKTSMGDITLELYPEKAPVTVENFMKYVDDGFYKGTLFHRVINTFMIQGGGFDSNMTKKNTRAAIKNEAANGLKNERGTIAMARTGVPDSATAQFFINTVDNRSLDFRDPSRSGIGYCVFGRVTDGMDVVDKIRAVATGFKGGMRDVPKNDVVIEDAVRVK